MKISNADRAHVLTHALPYIQKYTNKILVVKYGGNAMINEDLKQAVMEDIVLLSLVGIKVVLVHGGGPDMNDLLKKIGIGKPDLKIEIVVQWLEVFLAQRNQRGDIALSYLKHTGRNGIVSIIAPHNGFHKWRLKHDLLFT